MIPNMIKSSPAVSGIRAAGSPSRSATPAGVDQAARRKLAKQLPVSLATIRQNPSMELRLQEALNPIGAGALDEAKVNLALAGALEIFTETGTARTTRAASIVEEHINLRLAVERGRGLLRRV